MTGKAKWHKVQAGQAKEWLTANKERVKLKESKTLVEEIMKTDSQDFWQDIRDLLHSGFKK